MGKVTGGYDPVVPPVAPPPGWMKATDAFSPYSFVHSTDTIHRSSCKSEGERRLGLQTKALDGDLRLGLANGREMREDGLPWARVEEAKEPWGFPNCREKGAFGFANWKKSREGTLRPK
ncbi:hypothetical protein KFK09_018493 [Dendrobium nobile]|uniref:Uncharacterized protein n=1 Tax=Dendrobium nobile TaxID=94219 RepID=A0A8T3AVZ6_DENNO|nr:hypothetical protein KFK09_018493 [Dendrobium nobile]